MLEFLQNETQLNTIILVIAGIWTILLLRLLLSRKAKHAQFNVEEEYNRILNSDEYKVKRKYEA